MSIARSARLIAVLGAIVGALGTANSALAAESCVYDPVTRTVTASITANGQATLVGDGGVPNQLKFGQVPTACGGATTTNTDTINISGSAGGIETLVLDERSGVFAPGATSEFSTPRSSSTSTWATRPTGSSSGAPRETTRWRQVRTDWR